MIDSSVIEKLDERIEKSKIVSGYVKIYFEYSHWAWISRTLAKKAKGIEVYANIEDDYGEVQLYALNPQQQRFEFSFDQGGDMWDQDGYEDEVIENLDHWISLIPEQVKRLFPDFADKDNFIFDEP